VFGPALAAGSNMPWEQPLQQILQSIEGPVTKVVAVIVIITTGLSLAFGDAGGGFRLLIQIVFGLSIAFAASSPSLILLALSPAFQADDVRSRAPTDRALRGHGGPQASLYSADKRNHRLQPIG
jgi:type IV secretory pathway VirB2 component (pilin)